MRRLTRCFTSAAAAIALACPAARADITDLTSWTQVEDPPAAAFSGMVQSPSQVLLSADGGAPSATDIGYQSVSGQTAAASDAGFAFDPAFDFGVAIDFQMIFGTGANVGGLGIGFGIGEDRDGANGAGAGLLTQNGSAFAFGGAARIGDVTQAPQTIAFPATLSGSLHVSYDASTGDVVVGVGGAGANAPGASTTFIGIQNSWDGGLLFPSFFMRSDDALGAAWTSGEADVAFSDLRVVSGSAIEIPAPSAGGVLLLAGVGALRRRRKVLVRR